ncbi:histidinol-phosphate aminotransferase [Lachnospiraceae bacterium NE2001]|nr:histidinol-phosphate aminotransferase [Lachnospiraceae bacterium NE2001]
MSYNWEVNVRKVDPYTPGEQPSDKNIIKLNTNENPYGPSEEIKSVIASLDDDMLRRYPDATASQLVSELARFHEVSEDRVFVGVGSDDVLGMCFMTFFNSDKEILFPDVTYSFYPVWAEMLRIPYKLIPLKEDFTIDVPSFIDNGASNGGIVIANPNAPTGICLDRKSIIDIIESSPDSVVIVDEAYIDFAEAGASVIDLTTKYDNLIVVRTYSKSRSLAGLRIGYAISNPKMIKYLNDVKYSYNSYTMNYPSIVIGSAVIRDNDYFEETLAKIKNTREWFTDELKSLGFKVLPSSTNFVFASPQDGSARKIFESAKEKGIYVRYFNLPRIDDYLRITIGVDEDMKKVISFLKDFLTT